MLDIYTSRGSRGRWAEAFDGSTNGFYADYDLKIFLRKPTNIYGISTYNLGNSILNIYIYDETFKPIDKFDKFRLCRI